MITSPYMTEEYEHEVINFQENIRKRASSMAEKQREDI